MLFLIPFYIYRIDGESMLPLIKNGSSVVVNRFSYLFKNPINDDVIAVRDPRDGKILIKRITGIVNGKYFLKGDNKNASTDSRDFGMIERKSIIGKVIMIEN